MHCDIAQISKMSTWSEQFVHIFPGKQKLNKERGGRMKIFRMAFGKAGQGKYASCISQQEYREIMSYARIRGVKLEGFKRFSGDIKLIREIVDDIVVIAKDFPRILVDRRSVVVRFEENLLEGDFATTDRHLISINASLFNDTKYLEQEYKSLSDRGKFVRGTNYRSVIRHELGHVVANIYKINPMNIAKEIFQDKSNFEILEYIHDDVSAYASDYEDGREFISECFSAYYSNIDIFFANEYVNKCKEYAKEVYLYDKK